MAPCCGGLLTGSSEYLVIRKYLERKLTKNSIKACSLLQKLLRYWATIPLAVNKVRGFVLGHEGLYEYRN
jgi:hypothetical protein